MILKKTMITFFYTDVSEYFALLPLIKEAKKKSISFKLSKNICQKSEVGIYSVHTNSFWDFHNHKYVGPNSNFNVIFLHDLYQDNGEHSNFFISENWSIFDVAFVPGLHWLNIVEAAQKRNLPAFPKLGVYSSGWMRSFNYKLKKFPPNFEKLYKKKILIAPSWSSVSMIQDIIENLNIDNYHIMFKFFDYSDTKLDIKSPWYKVLKANRTETYKAIRFCKTHDIKFSISNDFRNLFKWADLVISNGSNVMFEALAMKIPSISIREWMQPYGNYGEFMKYSDTYFDGIINGSIYSINHLVEHAFDEKNLNNIKFGSQMLVDSKNNSPSKILKLILKLHTNRKNNIYNKNNAINNLSPNITKIKKDRVISEVTKYQNKYADEVANKLKQFEEIDKIKYELHSIKTSKLYRIVLKLRKFIYFHKYLINFLK